MDVEQLFTDAQLRAVHAAGVGVIFNGYPTYRVLHVAHCWSVERMDTKTEKFAGGSAARAQTWADARYGPDGWKTCGLGCLADVR
jgi:hypothetical protein